MEGVHGANNPPGSGDTPELGNLVLLRLGEGRTIHGALLICLLDLPPSEPAGGLPQLSLRCQVRQRPESKQRDEP